jgi:hypothetical protein
MSGAAERCENCGDPGPARLVNRGGHRLALCDGCAGASAGKAPPERLEGSIVELRSAQGGGFVMVLETDDQQRHEVVLSAAQGLELLGLGPPKGD